MTIKQIARNNNAVTDVATEKGFATSQQDKTFQVVLRIDPQRTETEKTTFKAGVLTAQVRIDASNDGVHWFTLYPAKTLTKAAGADDTSDKWAANLAELWGYHRAVIEAIDDGGYVDVFMAQVAFR